MNTTNCPVCSGRLNKAGHTVFCGCGWHKSLNQKQQARVQHKISKGVFVAGVALMGLIVWFNNWGSSSISIVSLKAGQLTGQMNEESFSKMKNICMRLKKYDCVEEAHKSFYHAKGDLKTLEQLGDFQYRRKRFDEAANTYGEYFQKKGTDVKSAYNYARILENKGQTDFALSYYQYALKARPGTVQVTVMRSYIDLLVKSGQSDKAKAELLKLKPILKRAGSLVQQEYDRWQKQII